jgi:DNA-binding transcriptional regulator YdaS (Cro superfamily)
MDLKTWCAAERGRASILASTIGIPVSFMSQMVSGDRPVPPQHAAPIEAATGRQVMRWELRPDDWHRIWPELVGADGAPPFDRRRGEDRRAQAAQGEA